MKHILFKRLFFFTLAVAFLGLTVGIAFLAFSSKPTNCAIKVPRAEMGTTVFLDSYTPYDCVYLETVDTEQSRAQGLSGREYLAPTRGMLFVFDQPKKACMWMKDMNFSLDIIWLDENKRIINIKEHVAPETYPQSFCPVQLTKYVIEINAGYEIGHDDNFHYSRLLPSKLSTKEVEAFRHVAVLGCRTLGMKNSPAHIEIIRTAEGPRIVEIGARIGGYRERMHKVANEIDMFGASIAIAQGHLPQLEKKRDDPCAVLELFPKISGNFVGIRNYKQAAMLPSCLQIYIKVKPGQKVGRAADGFKMCAIVILHHSNPEQFNKDLAFINESVSVQTN